MNLRTVLWLVGVVFGVVALAEIPGLAVAILLGEPWVPFGLSIATGFGLTAALLVPVRDKEHALDHRSAFLAVTLCWLAACALGAGPFINHPVLGLSVIDAFFESASGFTTTGATVLAGLDQMPRSILLWRSMSQWLGGMGVVLLGVAVFPILGLGGMQLFRAEAPGPTKDKLTPRIADTAKLLWVLYLGLTVAGAGLLYLGGMSIFDAICHAMTAISTGGFSTHDLSLGYFDSTYIHFMTSGLMLLGGTSFAVLHRAMTQGIRWSDYPELRLYLGIFILVSLIVTLDLRLGLPDDYTSWGQAIEHGVFQCASILTTTGFTTRDFDLWPPVSHAVILSLFFVGGMAGSTGGGVKVIRILLLMRLAFAQFFKLIHPHGFSALKLGRRVVDNQIIMGVIGFFAMWLLVLALGTATLCFLGSDVFSGFSAAAVTLGNIGPGFADVGPSRTYAGFSSPAKLTMGALMILGRLEIYTALVILTPAFWRR
jgi:trk system potassium uptake protein TrkH